MNYCVLDIETVPDELPLELQPECKLGNLVDPVKIAAKQADFEDEKIKVMSLHPGMNKIVSLQLKDYETWLISSPNDEKEALMELWSVIPKFDVIVGYNHIGFDLPTIMMRSMLLHIPPSKEIPLRRYSNYPCFDVMQELAGWDMSKVKSLSWWGKRFGYANKESDGGMIYDWYKSKQFDAINEHCKGDAMLTEKIYRRLRENSS